MDDEQNRTLLKVLPVVLLIALALAGSGLYFAMIQIDLLFHGETTIGKVTAVKAGSTTSASGRPTWFPIVVFTTSDGTSITFRHRTGHSPPSYAVGDRVTVSYLPDDPEGALIAEGFMNWLLPLALLIIGLGLTFLVIRGMVAVRRQLSKSI
jgi:hypothetical protein